MFWKCKLLLWVGVVQTSKLHIFCFFKSRKKFRFFWEIIWDASHNHLIELTISDPSWFQWLDIGGFTMDLILRGMLFLVPLHPLYVLGVENNMNWDGLHSPNVNHCLIHLLGINFKAVFGKKNWCFLHFSYDHAFHIQFIWLNKMQKLNPTIERKKRKKIEPIQQSWWPIF